MKKEKSSILPLLSLDLSPYSLLLGSMEDIERSMYAGCIACELVNVYMFKWF